MDIMHCSSNRHFTAHDELFGLTLEVYSRDICLHLHENQLEISFRLIGWRSKIELLWSSHLSELRCPVEMV